MGGVVRNVESVPEIIGGVADHVHLLIGLRATARLCMTGECVNYLHQNSLSMPQGTADTLQTPFRSRQRVFDTRQSPVHMRQRATRTHQCSANTRQTTIDTLQGMIDTLQRPARTQQCSADTHPRCLPNRNFARPLPMPVISS